MKTMIRIAAVLFTAIIFLTANIALAQQKAGGPWKIPAEYQAKKSTIKAGDASINSVGKDLYMKNCKSCHGAKGLGDGPKAASLKKTIVPSFDKLSLKTKPDGELYYQSIVGRDEMPKFEAKITNEADRWALIYYIKTL